MPAIYYQNLWQALRIIEQRLHVEDGCVDYSIDPELGDVHEKLMVAAVSTGCSRCNLALAESIQKGIIL